MKPIEEIYNLFLACTGISTDTRTISDGQLFVALKGPTFDGNQYASLALSKGAKMAIIDDPLLDVDERYILVNNCLDTLQDLARYHRQQISYPVIGLTGSNGKTSTKELLAAVLSTQYAVSATAGNYNNHIGVPLTVLSTSDTTSLLIVEMGSNQPGDIAQLCTIAQPSHGLITNIGASHLEKLKSTEGVFKEKRALFDHVRQFKGVFFLNNGDPYLKNLETKNGHLIKYNSSSGPFGTIAPEDGSELFLKVLWSHLQGQSSIQTNLTGNYNLENIAAVLSVAIYFGITREDIISAICNYKPGNMRSQITKTNRNTLVLDAYNANPSSMRESVLSLLQKSQDDLYFIIGDMLELGVKAKQYHNDIIMLLKEREVENVILVGPLFGSLGDSRYPCYENVDDLIESEKLRSISNQTVLLKGSRGMRLERLKDYL